MDILPAIDLRDGKVVRLLQGDYDRQVTYGDDPAAVAEQFVAAGAGWIHVVDLDAARSGQPTNTDSVRAICDAIAGRARVEFGGGVRDRDTIVMMRDVGVSRVVIGSAAMKNPVWFRELLAEADLPNDGIALGLDARDGYLRAEGWTEKMDQTADAFAREVAGSGLGAIVYTDIARDGMLTGVNVEATRRVIDATDVPVVASGGVRSLEDVTACRDAGCAGMIVGKAYYEGRIDIAEACELARQERNEA
jgi:phosphoribosylformimino-5-aminoimidazole carboxamide ribotide isomerase